MTSDQIRQQFVDFFVQRHGHTFVPSSPVVPHDDPTLLFTNAGMNQFKPIFLGTERRAYTRAANTQKCIRAGGKHNDLDDVGRSRRHHTFFEMLGNWSFGDYFKEGAIGMAWELLTQVWKLDPSRLHVSCFEGNEAAGIPRDTDAAEIWKQVAGLPDDHIHYFGKDNFWEMGDTGPCGPCTEIYIDRTPGKTGGNDVNGEDPRVMEIWNLVFIQYNRDAAGRLTPLPAQHVDTGMGFERICQVLQDKHDNYAIDLWAPIFEQLKSFSGISYGGQFTKGNSVDPEAEAANPQLRSDIAFRVIADHVRCLTFALTDGAVPSNEGRGYVLRRILRRAARFGRQQLGLREPFMHRLVPVIVDSMGGAFPELKSNPRRVEEIVGDEEVSFGRTLDRGIELFEQAVDRVRVSTLGDRNGTSPRPNFTTNLASHQGKVLSIEPGGMIPAEAAFKLHDTYGFPIDLTRIMAEERGMSVDIEGYERLMEAAKERARSGGKGEQSSLVNLPPDTLVALADAGVTPTDDQARYSHDPIEARVMAIWNGDDLGLSPADVLEDEELAVILDRTNFYAEMGGQVGDTGELRGSGGAVFDVMSTKVVAAHVLHIGRIRSGRVRAGDAVTATVAPSRRRTEENHTATHIANWALREVLGEGVQQKGSLVDPEKLRFDFSHERSVTDEEVGRVESLVGEAVARELPVFAQVAPQEQTLKINGLRAVFGEKYPPMVRVVSVGVPVEKLLADPGNAEWRKFSIEFCGGTHLSNSVQAGGFAVMAEESVSKGIRRIVAHTGETARLALAAAGELDAQIQRAIAAPDADLPKEIAALNQATAGGNLPLRARRRAQAASAQLQARYKAFQKAQAKESAGTGVDAGAVAASLIAQAAALGPGKMIVGEIPGASDDQIRAVIDSLKKKVPSYGVLLAAAAGDKVTFIAVVSDDLIAKGLKAGDWVKQAAKVAGGGGGGRPQMAQAGGKDPAKLPDALRAAREFATAAVG